MKKFTLFLSFVFAFLTASAQEVTVTSLDQLSNDKTYFIESARCFLMYNTTANADGISTSTATNLGTSTVAKDWTDANQQFKIENIDGSYYLYSVGAAKYVTSNGGFSDTATDALGLTPASDVTYNWLLTIGGNGMNSQEPGQMAAGIVVNSWTTEDPGNRYKIIDAEASTVVVVDYPNEFSEFEQNKCYTVSTTSRGGWAVANDAFCSTNDAGLTSNSADSNQQFAVLSNDGENYYLYSVGAKKFVKSDKSLIAGRGEAIELADASSIGECRVRVNFKGYTNKYINLGGSKQMIIDGWSAVDAGNAVAFIEAGEFDPTEALAMLNNVATITYQFKYEGNVVATQEVVAVPGEAYPDYTLSAPYGVTGAAKPEGTVSGDETVTIELTITKALPFEAVAEGEPTKWYYAQIHGNNLSYMTNPGIGAEMPWKINGELITAIDEANADNYTWGFVGNLWTGFKMVSKAGGAIKSTGSGNITIVENIEDATPFIAMTPATGNNAAAEVGFCLLNAEAGQYINAQNVGVNHWTSNDAGSTIVVTEREITVEPEPEAPFEIVAVTPTEAVAELSTVTVEFSEEIEGTFDMMAMTQIYLGTRSNGCSFEVNGKVLTITPFNAINTPGEYKLVIPEGLITRKSNGEAVTMNGEYVFTVKEAEAPFEVVAVTPTEAIEELTTVTVEFSEEIEGTFDMMAMTQIYLGTRSNGCSFEVNGKVLTITPFNAINTPGEYKLVIPEGLITRKSNGEAVTMNGEYVFTVKEAEAPFEVVAVTPTEAVAELTAVTVEFSEEIEGTFDMMAMTQIYLGTRSNGCSFEVNGKVLTITPFNAINTPGEYKLVIPEGLITRKSNGEAVTMNGEYVFTVKEATVEPEVIPAANKSYTVVAEGHTNVSRPQWAINDEGTAFVSTGNTTVSTDAQKQFAFVTYEGAIYIYSISAKKFVMKDASLSDKNPDAVQLTELENGKFFFKFDADHNVNIGGSGQMTIDWWSTIDGGNQFTLTEAGDFDATEALALLSATPEPEAPLNVVAVTPAEDEVVNSLREITIEFDAEIAVKELSGTERISIDYGWGVFIGTTATVEGKLLKLVADTEIKDNGTYPLTIPAGVVTRVSDGVAYEGGTFTFTVEKAAVVVEPLTVVAVTPAESVEKLETITIEFSDKVDVPATASGKFTIADADGNNVATLYAWDAAVDGKVVTLTLTEAITEAGEYTFSFAEGLVTRQGDGATCAYTCTINVTGVVGIDSIYGEAGDSVIYDITGRKIDKITEGGIYIVNGKKVLVK